MKVYSLREFKLEMRRLKVCVEIFPFFSGVFKRVYSLQEFHLGKKKRRRDRFFFFWWPSLSLLREGILRGISIGNSRTVVHCGRGGRYCSTFVIVGVAIDDNGAATIY